MNKKQQEFVFAGRALEQAPIRDRIQQESPIPPSVTLPSVKASDTSVKAAKRMTPGRASADEMAVLCAIAKTGDMGLTDDELEQVTGICHQTVSARRNGLVQKRRLRDSGQRRVTRSGCDAIVWVVGEGVPVQGAPNRRALKRPSSDDLRAAADALKENTSSNVAYVREWLLKLAMQG